LTEDQGKAAELMIGTLRTELGRYPRAFLRDHGPTNIWIARDVRSQGVTWVAGGVTSERNIYLNVDGSCTESGRARLIQHEFYHMLDRELFVDSRWAKAWTDLNPPGFRYLDDYNKYETYETHPEAGFVSSYAETNPREDRAETFAFTVVAPHSDLLAEWTEDDAYLAKKASSLNYWLAYAWPELTSSFFGASPNASSPSRRR
jgi:hypothetical protein